MSKFEAVFLWSAVWLYGLSFVAFLYGTVFKKDKWLRYGRYLAIGAFLMQTTSMGIRWFATGHPPVMRVYENSMLSSWFIMVLYMVTVFWQRRMEMIGVVIIPVILLMIGNGALYNPLHQPLSPPFKSNWLWLHIFFAWVAYGAFCLSAGLGVLYLMKERAERRGEKSELYSRLPGTAIINDLILRFIMFGFVALTVEIGAGALWAYDLWGRYWGWDPVETWSLVCWLIYGIDIHLGVTLGWKGKRMAWLGILSLISIFIAFGGIGFISGVHTPIL